MLPTITTTHAVPNQLPATHVATTLNVKFCDRCHTVLSPVEPAQGRNKKKAASHRCVNLAAARRPSVSVPFS